MGRCWDFKRVKTLSGFLSVIAVPLHIFHIGCEIGDIVNDSFMTHTYGLGRFKDLFPICCILINLNLYSNLKQEIECSMVGIFAPRGYHVMSF